MEIKSSALLRKHGLSAEATEVIERLGRSDIWLLDGGTLPQSGPSTIIDCASGTPTVLREGTVPVGRLRCVIPEIHANHP